MSDGNVIKFPGETRWLPLPAPANDDDAGDNVAADDDEPVGFSNMLLNVLRVNAGGIAISAAICAALIYWR